MTRPALIRAGRVDRADPENREFKHADPIGWTENNRAEILRALYTILLGNPMLKQPRDAKAKTRFKVWWRLIGSAVEHAASQNGETVDFQKLFMSQEEDEEDTVSLADALIVMRRRWGTTTFKASDVADVINRKGAETGFLEASVLNALIEDSAILRDFLFGSMNPSLVATSKSVGKRLSAHVDEPVMVRGTTIILRGSADLHDGVTRFSVA
jgi:hypothetical protein